MTGKSWDDMEKIAENIKKLRDDMKDYPRARLMGVVKTRTGDEIKYAVKKCGLDLLGENRVQEFLLHEPYFDGAEVHFIGTLQKNKVKYLIGKVKMIESVDSLPLAEEISRRSIKAGIKTEILIEVNTGCEPQKSGVMPDELPELLAEISGLDGVVLRGLMTVAPRCDSDDERRGYFRYLRQLKDKNAEYFISPILSMGMTESYREALAEGADIIRIGTGIFGERTK